MSQLWAILEVGDLMKCLNCGARNMDRIDDSHFLCPYCLTQFHRDDFSFAESNPSSTPKKAPLDYAQFEPAIVNLFSSEGNGTGFIIHSKGWVLTNQHVIQDEIIVQGTVGDSVKKYELEVLATGTDHGIDIALLEILNPDTPFTAIQPATENPKIGEVAVTIGNPKNLGISLSKGTVSRQTKDVLQLDITVNAGNSGGPVLNESGECIGVISYKQAGVEGYGFAVPFTRIKRFLADYQQLKEQS